MLWKITEAPDRLTTERPLMLVLEDLHWSDGDTRRRALCSWTMEVLTERQMENWAVIFEAEIPEDAYKMAEAEEYTPQTDAATFYFSFWGDGLTACKNRGCVEISQTEMEFLERVGMAFRK